MLVYGVDDVGAGGDDETVMMTVRGGGQVGELGATMYVGDDEVRCARVSMTMR